MSTRIWSNAALSAARASDEELAIALANATQVIIADDADRFNHVAAGLALENERVLLLDWPEGTPLPLRGGGGA